MGRVGRGDEVGTGTTVALATKNLLEEGINTVQNLDTLELIWMPLAARDVGGQSNGLEEVEKGNGCSVGHMRLTETGRERYIKVAPTQ